MRNKKAYRSGFEVRVAKNLDKAGISYEFESVKLPYTKKECQHCGEVVESGTYTPDFILPRSSGIRLVVECKGYLDSQTRTKMQRVKRANPGEDIRILFQRNQPIRKGSKTFYDSWALKNGFPCAFGDVIPKEWIDGPLAERQSNPVQRVAKKVPRKNARQRSLP